MNDDIQNARMSNSMIFDNKLSKFNAENNDANDRNLKIQEIRSILDKSSQFTLQVHDAKMDGNEIEDSNEDVPEKPGMLLLRVNDISSGKGSS